jgi:hypothetical protein
MTPPLDPQVRELIAEMRAACDYSTTTQEIPLEQMYAWMAKLDALLTRPVPDHGLTLEGATRAVVERAASYKCRCTDTGCRPCLACEATNVLRPPKTLAASRPDGEARPSAGDLLCATVERWEAHQSHCDVDPCGECDAVFNQVRLALKVWRSSSYKRVAAPPVDGEARPQEPVRFHVIRVTKTTNPSRQRFDIARVVDSWLDGVKELELVGDTLYGSSRAHEIAGRMNRDDREAKAQQPPGDGAAPPRGIE